MDDGCQAILASRDGTLRSYDLQTGQLLRPREGQTASVWALAVTPDERRAVSAWIDQTLRVWELESRQTLRTLEGHTDWVTALGNAYSGVRSVCSVARYLRKIFHDNYDGKFWSGGAQAVGHFVFRAGLGKSLLFSLHALTRVLSADEEKGFCNY